MEHSELKNLIAAYCIGALDEEEKRQLEGHLKKGCPECDRVKAEMLDVATLLVATVEEKIPPVYLKNRILSQIQPDASPVRVVKESLQNVAVNALEKSRRLWIGVSAALAVASVALIFIFTRQISQLENQLGELRTQVQINEQVVNDLQLQLQEKERILNVVRSARVQLVQLRGLEAAPDAEANVFWSESEKKALFVARNLPTPASDKDYQLWIIRGGKPVDAGVFAINEEGVGLSTFDITDDQNVSAFAVTLEKKGGVPTPQGDMYLLGTI
ncbi:MAG TPA: anti-sigma factor [bacterium]